jgi:hypothetical protein
MADKDIAFKLEIDGVEQSIKSVKDLKGAIKALQDEAENADLGSDQYKNAIENIEKLNDKLQEVTRTEKQTAQAMEDMAKAQKEAAKETGDLRKQFEVLEDELFLLAGQGKQNTKEFRDLANEAASLNKKIEQVNQSLEGGAVTKSAEGYQMLSGSFTSLKEGILELDFGKIKDGLQQAKQGFVMFGQGAKTALQGVKGALLATGIGAFVVILGTIVAYWDDIKGAIDGVTSEQKKLNAAAAENLAVEQEKSKALDASTNSLKLQGKSEREILELKVKQLDIEYEKAEVALQNTIQTQLFQVEAEKRNKAILTGMFESTLKPVEYLLSAIDMAGKALGKNFGLAESIKKMTMDSVSGDDAEKEAARKKELDASIQVLKDLKEKRAGFQLAINKIDDDAAKVAADAEVEATKIRKENAEKEAAERLARQKSLEEAQLSLTKIIVAEKIKVEEDGIEQLDLILDKATQKRIDDAHKQKLGYEELEKEKYNLAKQGIDGVQALSDMYFLFRSQKAQKGSKEEAELAKKAFNVNKALQLATATINGIQAVQGAFATATASPITTVFPAYPFIQAGLAGVLAAANVAKIAASKFDSGASGGGGGGGDVSAPMPSIPAPPTIATGNNNTNQSTLFDESGQNLGFKQKQPQINVTATVGVDEIASKSNRVSVLEQQSTF